MENKALRLEGGCAAVLDVSALLASAALAMAIGSTKWLSQGQERPHGHWHGLLFALVSPVGMPDKFVRIKGIFPEHIIPLMTPGRKGFKKRVV